MLKRNREQVAAPRASRSIGGGNSLTRVVLVVLVLVAVALVLVGLAAQQVQQQNRQQLAERQAAATAASLSRRMADQVAFNAQVLQRFAGQRQLATLLQSEDWKGLRQQERQLSRLLPDALRVRILPVDYDQPAPDEKPPFSFASLEMLRAVERSGKPSVAEVHQFGSPGQHIALAAPVADSGSGALVGVVHLALPFALLEQDVRQAEGVGGHLELQQLAPGGAVDLVHGNGEDRPDAGMLGGAEVPGAIWRVAYWPADSETANGLLLWAAVAAVLMLVVLVLAVLLMRHRAAVRHDQAALLSLVEGLLNGTPKKVEPARLPEFQTVMGLMLQSARKRPVKPVAEAPPADTPASKAAEVPTGWDDGNLDQMLSKDELMPDEPVPAATQPAAGMPANVFRAYDIRGVAERELSAETVYAIGRAIGSEAQARGQQTVIVGRDGRNSSETLSTALCRGLMASGRDVVDLGLVPTPTLYFATHFLGSSSGVMVTGSHNPPEYNGLKVVIDGEALNGEAIQGLRQRIEHGDLAQGEGTLQEQDLIPDYIGRITEDVQLLRSLKIVIDCGNGAASVVAPSLFRALGCDVKDLFCAVDGNFPNHHPDPGNPENLATLIKTVKAEGADLGIAFDGDGDRIGVVDSQGRIIWPDRLLMLLARDVLLRQPGVDVIYDVKSTRHLAGEILAYGGRPIMWKSGHSLIKAKLRETGALLAGEMSGHIFLKERWYGFDDGLYAAARLLEVLSAEGLDSSEVFAQLPDSLATPELEAAVAEEEAVRITGQLAEQAAFPDAKLITIDGVRAEFGDGWGLVRSSNTLAAIKFRFEADDEAALTRIQGLFRDQLLAIEPTLKLPF